jgi:serine/threonine protein kinase
MRPERFGRYVLLDRIAVGGMAEVFRAVMPGAEGFRRTFVVKRILGHLCETGDFVEMFVREARICALLNHPSIVQVYDFGNVDGTYFLAMEYVRGRDLQQVLRQLRQAKQAFPVALAASVAREVADGLGYAHELAGPDGKSLNIIHRDVSPSNIMCSSAGGVKLLDFGIAKAIGEAPADRTERGAFKGKHAYMAPERIKREPIDGRSDLFSLGVVLWEMLTGRRLFRGANDLETLKNVLEAVIPVPSSLRPEVPPALDAIVMRALERDPAARTPSGQAMADDLEETLQATRYQSKMLPALLRELFGSGLQSDQVALSGLAEQLLDGTTTDSSTGGSTAGSLASESPYELFDVEVAASGWTRRRISAVVCAMAVTATLGVLLFARGGGARSNATTLPARASPAGAAKPASPTGAAAAVVPEPAPVAPGPVVTSPVSPPKPDDGVVQSAPADIAQPRRPSRSRSHSNRDRISRGLSIDPFAEAAQQGHR